MSRSFEEAKLIVFAKYTGAQVLSETNGMIGHRHTYWKIVLLSSIMPLSSYIDLSPSCFNEADAWIAAAQRIDPEPITVPVNWL